MVIVLSKQVGVFLRVPSNYTVGGAVSCITLGSAESVSKVEGFDVVDGVLFEVDSIVCTRPICVARSCNALRTGSPAVNEGYVVEGVFSKI